MANPQPSIRSASKPNPALQPLAYLIGEWDTVVSHPMTGDARFSGKTSFEWIEGGAFLLMRSEVDDQRFPLGVSIFASDDSTGEYFMLTFDSRGVSRKYDVSVAENEWRTSRMTKEFSQRYVVTVSQGGNTMHGQGQMSRDGAAWEDDIGVVYTRRAER